MKKTSFLLAALLICCNCQFQANANEKNIPIKYNSYESNITEISDTSIVAYASNSHHVNVENETGQNYHDMNDNEGGALYTESGHTTNITESTFENNTAENLGGAVYNEGTLKVEGSSFVNNKADEGEIWEEDGYGGAVYNKNDATITNSTFTGNHAKYGGAIHNEKDANLTVQGIFKENTAQVGGAIHNYGGLTVKQGSVFENNSTTRFDGGAIVNYDGTINIEDNVTFKNNSGLGTDEKSGGAIHTEGDGNSRIQIGNNVIFEGNRAEEGGGIGLYKHNDVTIGENVTFKNNKASQDGGAIGIFTFGYDAPSNFTIGNNALFEGNQAGFGDEEEISSTGYVFGGAISISEGLYDAENYSSFTVGDNAIFRNNKAKVDDPSVFGYGGALYNAAFKTTVGDNALFEGNLSDIGGAVYNQANLKIGQNAAFKNNNAPLYGGAIYNCSTLTLGENALFEGNTATMGGAIYNASTAENSIQKAVFKDNQASIGGAIYNDVYNTYEVSYNSTLNIADSVFTGNTAKSDSSTNNGGAIYNHSIVKVTNSLFENNTANYMGGAIYNANNNSENEETNLTLEDSEFTKNSSVYGGAIAVSAENTKTNITKTTFKDNYAAKNEGSGGQGGAIYNNDYFDNSTLYLEDSVFENNTAEAEGGAIYSANETNIKNSQFIKNSSTGKNYTSENRNTENNNEGGGAIFVHGKSNTTVENSNFTGNLSDTVGGAIATQSNTTTNTLNVKGSTFKENKAKYNGGAIAAYSNTTITDTSFVDNTADNKGGAIWANGDITVKAENSDIVFLGNTAKEGGDIYMDNLSESGEIGTLKLEAAQDKNITITDGIAGAKEYNVNLNGAGTVTFLSEIKNANMKVTNGTLRLAEGSSLGDGTKINVTNAALDSIDGKINDYSGKIEIGSNSKLKFDLNSANRTTDKFSAAEGLQSGTVSVADFNFLPDTKISSDTMTINDIKNSLGLGEAVNLELPEKTYKTLTPLRYINVQSGENGISYTPAGNNFADFNLAVTPAPVAAQLGGYLTQLDSYDEAFRNMDTYMLMPRSMKQAMKYRNKYASADSNWNIVYDKAAAPYDNTALWARPYATFENVKLKRGPKVSNVSWGTYIGADSELVNLGGGWDGMWSLYAGYNGSHQAYNGISIYQNGGTLGLTGTLYKNNFFTGLTANAGANSAEASTDYGSDSFGLFRTGVASKTGYNFEFADGKFIIQPAWLMSYSFVNTENYNTSNGIRINSNPLHALQLEPGLKFIGNLGKGWQPYTGVSIVWNILDKTDFRASDATLPDLSIKPFFKYGVGLRKMYGERFVGYGQTYVTSGGRNGIGFQFGGRWTI